MALRATQGDEKPPEQLGGGSHKCPIPLKFLVGRGFCPAAELLLGVCGFSKGLFSAQSASMLQTGKPAGKPAAA